MAEPRVGVHDEPDCTDIHNGCFYPEPHKHGFACDRSCNECHGHCHPSCPEYPVHMSPVTPTPTAEDEIPMCKNCSHEDYYHYNGGRCQVSNCKCRKMTS